MSAELLKFWANFFAIIVFALAVDSQKKGIASFLVDEDEGFETPTWRLSPPWSFLRVPL